MPVIVAPVHGAPVKPARLLAAPVSTSPKRPHAGPAQTAESEAASAIRYYPVHPSRVKHVTRTIPQEPVTGRQDIANAIASVLRPGPPGIESIDFRLINIAANGPVVMTERVDVFTLPGKSFGLPVMGTFEISDGKISAWRDYFDLNQFVSRMG